MTDTPDLDGLEERARAVIEYAATPDTATTRAEDAMIAKADAERWQKISSAYRAAVTPATVLALIALARRAVGVSGGETYQFYPSGGGGRVTINLRHVASVNQRDCYEDERRVTMSSGETWRVHHKRADEIVERLAAIRSPA